MNLDMEKARVYAAGRMERRANGCRIWSGPIAKNGYGVANLPGGVRMTAHRSVARGGARTALAERRGDA